MNQHDSVGGPSGFLQPQRRVGYRRASAQQPLQQETIGHTFRAQAASGQDAAQQWCPPGLGGQPVYLEFDASYDLSSVNVDPRTIANVSIDTLTKSQDVQPWHAAPAPYQQGFSTWSSTSFQTIDVSAGALDFKADDQISMQDGSDMLKDSGYGSQRPRDTVNASQRAAIVRNQSAGSKSHASQASSVPGPAENNVQPASSSRRRSVMSPINCEVCGKELNSRSDATKHRKTHERPYKCKVPGCRYESEGFGTPNDCVRHMATKHKIYEPGAIVVGFTCCLCLRPHGGPAKWWPRQDNFKAHLKRKHGADLDFENVIEQCKHQYRPEDTQTVMSGGHSNYFPQSHADSDQQYQEDRVVMIHQDMSGQMASSVDTPLWPDQATSHLGMDPLVAIGQNSNLTSMTGSQYGSSTYATHGSSNDHQFPFTFTGQDTVLGLDAGPHDHSNTLFDSAFGQDHYTYDDDSRSCKVQRMEGSSWQSAGSGGDSLQRCKDCGKDISRRPCDQRKHEARHIRRYGCTQPQCYLKHGSKSDWLRHEARVHRLPQAWMCRERDTDGTYCNHFCRSEYALQDHLMKVHGIGGKEELQSRTSNMHLPREGRTRFWCGFCKTVCLNPQPEDPWSYRCQHIGRHMDLGGNCTIQEWICPELQIAKGSVTAEQKEEIRNIPAVVPPQVQNDIRQEQLVALLREMPKG